MIRVSRFYHIASVAAGIFIGTSLATSAFAGGAIGGNCCADLEERVAELEATTVRKGNRKVSLKVSGQISKFLMFWDNSAEDNVYIVDNSVSSSRFRLKGSGRITSTISAGFIAEFEFDSSESDAVSEKDQAGAGKTGVLDLRKAAWYLKSSDYGKISLGPNSTATDNIILVNLGRTGAIATSDTPTWNKSFSAIGAGGATWGQLLSGHASLDTEQANVVRYDTPTISGFMLSAAWGEDDIWDVALRWKGSVGNFVAASAIGFYDSENEGKNFQEIKGSATMRHVPTGLFFTGAFLNRDTENVADSSDMYYLQGGFNKRILPIGATTIFAEYGNNEGFLAETKDFSNFDSSVDMWGVGLVQRLDASALELFAVYRNYEAGLNSDGVKYDVEDFSAFALGGRIKF